MSTVDPTEKTGIPLFQEGDKVRVGRDYNEGEIDVLRKNSPTAEEIFENLDALREEIIDAAKVSGAEIVTEEEPRKLPSQPLPKPSGPARVSLAPSPKRGDIKRFDPRNRISSPQTDEVPMDSLDKELDELNDKANKLKASEKAPEGEVEAPPATSPDLKKQILDLLKKTPGAPTPEQIEGLKRQYGENGVHVLALGEGDVYIYTYLKRGQWKKIQEIVGKIGEAGKGVDLDQELKEKVVQYCTIWPKLSLEFFTNSRAGVLDTLYQVIMFNSYFLSPQQSMLLTVSL